MTPEQLAKSGTEHAEQCAFFAWANMAQRRGFEAANRMDSYNQTLEDWVRIINGEGRGCVVGTPPLQWLHAIPNAGARGNKIAASQLKAEGVKAGVADVFLPYSQRGYAGLYIELKREKGSVSDVSKEQLSFARFVTQQRPCYAWIPAYGWLEASSAIEWYFEAQRTLILNERQKEVMNKVLNY